MPIVDPPSRPRNAIVFSLRAFASSSARIKFFDFPEVVRQMSTSPDYTERRHLTRKDFIEAIVIPGGGENSAIARETNRRKRAAIFGKTHHKFRRKMRCISRAAAIPANKQFVSCAQTLIDHIGSLRHLWFEAGKCAKSLRCRFNRIA